MTTSGSSQKRIAAGEMTTLRRSFCGDPNRHRSGRCVTSDGLWYPANEEKGSCYLPPVILMEDPAACFQSGLGSSRPTARRARRGASKRARFSGTPKEQEQQEGRDRSSPGTGVAALGAAGERPATVGTAKLSSHSRASPSSFFASRQAEKSRRGLHARFPDGQDNSYHH